MKDLIQAYFIGNLSATEEDKLLAWLKESEENQSFFLTLYYQWFGRAAKQLHFDKEEALKKTKKRIQEQDTGYHQRNDSIHLRIRRLVAVAASLLLIVSTAVYFILRSPDKQFKQAVLTHTVHTVAKELITLPDQTKVWLAPNAILTYPEVFADNKREVALQGEAFFEVQKNSIAPFTVDLGDEIVEVLGTSFDISTSKGIKEVVLVSGKVALYFEDTGKKYFLQPNQKASYSDKNRQALIEDMDASLYTIKAQERLSFDNEKLNKVIRCLEIWYGVDIQCSDTFTNEVYVSFSIKDEELAQTMKMLSMIAPIEYNIIDKQVRIQSKK